MLLFIVIVYKRIVPPAMLTVSETLKNYGSWAVPISAAASVFLSHDCLMSLSCGQAQKFSSFLILNYICTLKYLLIFTILEIKTENL